MLSSDGGPERRPAPSSPWRANPSRAPESCRRPNHKVSISQGNFVSWHFNGCFKILQKIWQSPHGRGGHLRPGLEASRQHGGVSVTAASSARWLTRCHPVGCRCVPRSAWLREGLRRKQRRERERVGRRVSLTVPSRLPAEACPENCQWPLVTSQQGTDVQGHTLGVPGFLDPAPLLRGATQAISGSHTPVEGGPREQLPLGRLLNPTQSSLGFFWKGGGCSASVSGGSRLGVGISEVQRAFLGTSELFPGQGSRDTRPGFGG